MASSTMRSLLCQSHHPTAAPQRFRSANISRLLSPAPSSSSASTRNLQFQQLTPSDNSNPNTNRLSVSSFLGPHRFGALATPSWQPASGIHTGSAYCSPRRIVRSSASASSGGSTKSETPKPQRRLKNQVPQKPKSDPLYKVPVVLEDSLELTPDIEALLEQLENDGPMALKLAIDGIEDLVPSATTELSLLICDDVYIRNLNSEWRGKDAPTDVLSFPQDQPPGVSSLLLLGDVIISLDTAKRQAQERGHSVVDELRILLVHGLLHVLGYDHEKGPEAAAEMEKEELRILQGLGWNSKGLITVSLEGESANSQTTLVKGGLELGSTKGISLPKSRPPFKILLCDMDGTLLNGKSKITLKTAAALKEAVKRGVKVIIATGKTRPGAITCCTPVGLFGEDGIISESSPGVFVQGLTVYGDHGKLVHKQVLDADVVIKAFQYSLENKQPLLGFCGDRIVTLFDHPLVQQLHTVYAEPQPEVLPSVEYLVKNFQVQKLLFAATTEEITHVIRPYWAKEVANRARVVQAHFDMLEIIPVASSKGKGVSELLKSLNVNPDDVMAIGDGENDVEMFQLVGWSVAMGNAAPEAVAVADARTGSNDEDGVAQAIERFIL